MSPSYEAAGSRPACLDPDECPCQMTSHSGETALARCTSVTDEQKDDARVTSKSQIMLSLLAVPPNQIKAKSGTCYDAAYLRDSLQY